MHIAMKLGAALIASLHYPWALKHHDFLKKEIKNLLDAGIIHKIMSSWASPTVVVKKHPPEGAPQQFCLCIDYRKVNSLLPAVTPPVSTKKGALALMPLPMILELFALLKEAKYFTRLDPQSGYYHTKQDEESTPKSAFTTVFRKFEFPCFHLVYPKAWISLSILFITSWDLIRSLEVLDNAF